MLALIAAALAASTPSPVLESTVPWWERITVTVDDKGTKQLCQYRFSLTPSEARPCDEALAASLATNRSAQAGLFSKLTFERRFSPGAQLDGGRLQPGDALLGRKVLFLTFSPEGAVRSCEVVATSGDYNFQYDCAEARRELFRTQKAKGDGSSQAFMTILAYGHSMQLA